MKPMHYLHEMVASMADLDLKSACRAMLNDPQFPVWPAAIGMHHAYQSGLATHTAEVARYALLAGSPHPTLDRDVLIAACLWHDYAKVHEYEVTRIDPNDSPPENGLRWMIDEGKVLYWVRATYLKAVGHISGSAMTFYHIASQRGVQEEVKDAVCHAILAHHGPVREWGSPVAPQSLEAHLLHHADMLSAKFGATKVAP